MIKKSLLWSSLALSTVLSAGFFFSLGDNLVSGSFLAVLGVIFEVLKAYSWMRTGRRDLSFLWLAIPCTALSLAASIGYASLTLERGWSASDTRAAIAGRESAANSSLEQEEKALVDAMAKLPAGWTTSALRLGERLDAVRTVRGSSPKVPVPQDTEISTASLAVSLGHRFGLDGTWVVTGLLLCVATVLEVGIVVLVLDQDIPRQPKPTKEEEPPEQRFLRQAVGADGKLLGRRRLVELGWSEREVRDHVTTLIQSGVLTHEGRGSPIRPNQ